MKIKSILTLKFTLIVSTILLLFSAGILYFSTEYRTKEFKKRLTNRASTIARLLKIIPNTNESLFDEINKNTINLFYKENIFIYDFHSSILIYKSLSDSTDIFNNTPFLEKIKSDGIASDSKDEREIEGISYPETNPEYMVVVSAIDQYGFNILKNLRFILINSLIISFIIVFVSAFLFSHDALKPISGIIRQIDQITASKLHSRIITRKNKDEIYNLSHKFNTMLDRLENAFIMQRQFVSNASHELRTPLTSMKGQIDVILMKERTKEEYIAVLESLLADTENMTTLINGFLEMAESSTENKLLKVQEVRIDELLFSVKNEIIKKKNNYIINITFDDSISEESNLILNANAHLLRILFINLIDNACKFSNDHTANLIIQYKEKWIRIDIGDYGIGIPDDELKKITEPFYRARNANTITGHGVGLSIAKKIINLHKGILEITSSIDRGTNVMMLIPYNPRMFSFNNDEYELF